VGVVVADALPNRERPSPAAPSIFRPAALLVRFRAEVCLIRGIVASSKRFLWKCLKRQDCARRIRRARVTGDQMQNIASSSRSSSQNAASG
jgi:hypothetical protein